MPAKPTDLKTYSPREIGGAVNNCLLAASRPDSSEINPARLRRLSDYAAALTSPCDEHVEAGLLTPQELVVVYISCAALTHAKANVGSLKMPMIDLAKEVRK